MPNTDDILRVRIPTDAIVQRSFVVNGKQFNFFDVAGQKDKRSRWVPYLSSTLRGIIFIMSIASFDQRMAEDATVNRYLDSLVLFEELMGNSLLAGIPTILLLNKADLFELKVKAVNFSSFIVHYDGSSLFLT